MTDANKKQTTPENQLPEKDLAEVSGGTFGHGSGHSSAAVVRSMHVRYPDRPGIPEAEEAQIISGN